LTDFLLKIKVSPLNPLKFDKNFLFPIFPWIILVSEEIDFIHTFLFTEGSERGIFNRFF